MPVLNLKSGQVQPGNVQPASQVGQTWPEPPDTTCPTKCRHPTESRVWTPRFQPQPDVPHQSSEIQKPGGTKAKFEPRSPPSELLLQASQDASGPNVPHDLVKLLHYWLHNEVNTKFQIIDHKLDLLSAQMASTRVGRRSMNRLNARIRLSGQSVTSVDQRATPATAATLKPFSSEGDRDSADTSPPTSPSSGDLLKSSSGDLMARTSSGPSVDHTADTTRRRIESERYLAEITATIARHQGRGHVAASVWRFLENPYSSTFAHMYSIFVPAFVITSVCMSFLQTVKDSAIEGEFADWLQMICEILYATELVVRFLVCPDRKSFFCSLFNLIDLISALPLLVRLVVDKADYENNDHASEHWAHAVVVVIPLVRLLKLIRRFEKFHLLLSAFQIAFEALPVLLYTLMLIALVFSVIIYFVEPVDNIGSLPTGLWFIVVTMTTVGYGDITPVTAEGNVIMTTLMIISSLYMAIPIGIVGSAFSEVWGKRDRLLLMHRMRDAFMQEGFTADSMAKIVGLFDDDGDGELDLDEFQMMLRTMHVDIGDERVLMLHESIDKDGGGTINVGELINSLFPKAYAQYSREVLDGIQQGITSNFVMLHDTVGQAFHGIAYGIRPSHYFGHGDSTTPNDETLQTISATPPSNGDTVQAKTEANA